MKITKAAIEDIEIVKRIYESARKYMRESGNPDQWRDGYPQEEIIRTDIENGCLYLVWEEEEALAVFFCSEGPDPTYEVIECGSWLSDEPYAVIHRIAVSDSARGRGISRICFDFAVNRCPNIRIDTHKHNLPMQASLARYGFVRCGIIHIRNGEERVAFQYIKPGC